MNDLSAAIRLLHEGTYTCVLCSNKQVYTSEKRGVSPLVDWLDQGIDARGFSAADKVVGKGAAFLYVLLGVRAVYAPVMSQSAKMVLEQHRVTAVCDDCPERILNRAKTGFCPIESATLDIDDPHEALSAIKQRLKEL